jgi:SAM-dependent methyltransferase
MSDTYRDDLAYIHDVAFGQMAEAAGPVLIKALRDQGHESGLVIDLGCGSGILSRALVEAGYQVWGIDISVSMVLLARDRVPAGRFDVESILSARLTECVAVAAVGECLNYLFDPRHSLTALNGLFRRIHDALVPGGIFLLDVAEPGRVPGGGPIRTFVEDAEWALFIESEENAHDQILTRRMTTFRRVGNYYRRDREIHHQLLIPRETVKSALEEAGFRVSLLDEYGTLRFPVGLVGYLARTKRPDEDSPSLGHTRS